ncbi:hypothetical protein [uncultured Jatrophihabitans sp.]|uniref:hypothetical protein n=1 Tax=uncultured Jatrophihabitans sp. TaxID=1610747 RepID=UPI0035CC1AF7
MVLAPNTRLIKIALAALVGAVGVLAGVVAIAAPAGAGARTGAQGLTYQRSIRSVGGNRMQLAVAGYAYNRNSMPLQDVKAVVYGERQRGGARHRLFASSPHPADGRHFDARNAGRRMTKYERAYTFAWRSSAFDAASGGRMYRYLTVCLWARDSGSHASYTKIDKCRPVEQSARTNS